ncbi:MAG: hypothetical protein ACREU5_00325, partial [Burkholderiales bacterium]
VSDLGAQLATCLGHKKVLIIDDAYDATPALDDIGDEAVANCREELEDEQVRQDFEQIANTKVNTERLADLLAEVDIVERLWDAREAKSPAKKALEALFAQAGKALSDKRKPVEPLERLLKDDLKLEIVTLGSTDIEAGGRLAQHAKDARLFFVDYYLDPQSKDAAAVEACVKKVASIYKEYTAGDRPIVILMSSERLALEDQQRFRRTLNALGSHFAFIHKPELKDAINVQIALDGLGKTYKQACAIDKAMDTWEQAARDSVGKCAQDLRALDISDYAFLDKFRLDEERVQLGHYVLWLYGEYLNSLVEKRPEISKVADELDAIPVEPLFPPSLMPRDELVQVYSGTVFTDFRPKPPRQREQDDAHKYRVMLGDMYRRKAEAGTTIDAAVVITPACNLARASGTTPVTLLKGVLRPKVSTLKDEMVPEFLKVQGETYSAKWDLDAPLVMTVKELTEACEKHEWERVTRLRPLYALYLQRQYLAEMMRVGMPVATQWYFPLCAEVYGKGAANAATLIMQCTDVDALVWRITGADDAAIVFLERFITRLRTALQDSTLGDQDKKISEKLDDLINLRAPLVVKGKEVQVGDSFGVVLLREYKAMEKHNSGARILIRVFAGEIRPPKDAAGPVAAAPAARPQA